jgi:ribosomal-protein-alanine N-acetyltransferase
MEEIRPIRGEDDARRCAQMMCSTEPWITMGRTFDESLAIVRDGTREVYVAGDADQLLGFIIINMRGAFIGYIQIVCVDGRARGGGVGTRLIEFAEQRIFRDAPNVFLCVSSFNDRARALYERLGYEKVGELKDYLIDGASEFLMRKTIGPLLRR